MRIEIERRHWIVFGVGIILLLAIFLFMYITEVRPVTQEQERLQTSIESLEEQLAAREREESVSAGDRISDRYSLFQRLPSEPRQDEFLLQVDRAEEMSGSQVLSAVHLADGPETGVQTAEETEPDVTVEGEETAEENPETTMTAVPEEVESMTYQFIVESPSYENAERFMEVIDDTTRLLHIHSLQFSGQEEWIWREEEPQPLTFNVVISAYFYSGDVEE
ncbi:hypothetical protein [Alteribacillus iranensis]|uniref:Type IV pilus assembly protein PilO n=1 Tax=Alteribacillus iranensis TaxID=930128 RepID=A0A1I2CQW3_9BACI|nr:hypothetical protein [Alteribacillus iranensis]SFE70624.1 hypothetical protein SAMN05192532_103146 [Alteribacillus iranensis]